MDKNSSQRLGVDSIFSLLIRQGLPASIGILVMSLNILIDTIFVGQWIGSNAIAAINVVLPVSFFIAAIGMAIGIGGGSIISRALGEKNIKKAKHTFGNQITLTFCVTLTLSFLGLVFLEFLIPVFGGKGDLYELAKTYYVIVLYGVPVLGFCMMGNNTMRAEGKPEFAMYAMMIPSVTNLLLDYILIYHFDMGMLGAAWATTISYIVTAIFIGYFFLSNKSELKIGFNDLNLSSLLVREISALGSVTLARQAMVSIVFLLVNNILFSSGGESTVAIYAIISRMLMFALFPVIGITQGFIPIVAFNYGSKNYKRVYDVVIKAVILSSFFATTVFTLIFYFSEDIVSVFSDENKILNDTPSAMRWVFAATPIIGIQLIGAAYFQAIGKAMPALLLTLTRQGFFFVPLLFILSNKMGVFGVWLSFPLAELIATIVTGIFLHRGIKKIIV
ncbi:MAG: MATE family efflux transporter [Flavobacteriaceae bacterium TMED116]|mgnify:FL=1|nr:MAG: MATE family efflux transporter [Flavobacteriaceae bacterium TMED116]|tara:strand:- start:767 stop:2107 length:1341 start_codon:yes stop_codon:yes gene_type:complete